MIDTIIVSGGNIQKDFALDFLRENRIKAGRENLCLIAADRGLEFFMEIGEKEGFLPDMAVGDFDSLSEKGKEYLEHISGLEICRLKPEKDDSDTQSAVLTAIRRGSRVIAILGATGSRIDHVFANIELLSLGKEHGVEIILADSCNYITLAKSVSVLERSSLFGKFVSFFPVGGYVECLTLRGFHYPLTGHLLTAADSGLTVSNEIVEERAVVTYESGTLLMIMSRD